ncbi:MAG TPA: cytochrome c nitrite reductase small subunit [Tepidisphaeraceae bacterium]|nr:cytochrome c nitrite reductase small subunit [Tepidisphaeraceae bacterium]
MRLRHFAIIFAVMVGVAVGVSTFTFHYARGASYLSNDPKACVNCHIMNDQYDGWLQSPHHAVAVCNDCHVPHDFVGKWIAKAANGYHHSKAFTLQNFHEPIMITPHNADTLQANCLRCHGDLVSEIVHGSRETHVGDGTIKCVQCHRRVGHGP